MKFSFRVRKRYFDSIVAGEKTVEYRRDIYFWQIRIKNMVLRIPKWRLNFIKGLFHGETLVELPDLKDRGIFAVFICGGKVHRREVVKIARIKTPKDFSDQGNLDVNTPLCWAFHLGKQVF